MLKNTFSENDVLLQAMRKVFLQLELTEGEDKIVKGTFKGKEELMTLIRKVFLPTLDAEAPRHQLIDLWMSVDIKDKKVEAFPQLKAVVCYWDEKTNPYKFAEKHFRSLDYVKARK